MYLIKGMGRFFVFKKMGFDVLFFSRFYDLNAKFLVQMYAILASRRNSEKHELSKEMVHEQYYISLVIRENAVRTVEFGTGVL